MRCLVYQLIFCSLAFSADPAWIWKEKGSASQIVYFRREFTLPEVPKRAEFRGGAVDSMYIHVNAERLGGGTGGGWPGRLIRWNWGSPWEISFA